MHAEVHNAIKRARAALATKDLLWFQTYYLQSKGRLYAQNGRIQISTPCPIDGEFLISGEEFERALDKLPADKLTIERNIEECAIVVKGGRFRTTIQTVDPDEFLIKNPTLIPVPAFDPLRFHYALDSLRPFISENATKPFSLSFNFEQGRAAATNNIVVAECADTGLPNDVSFLLPQWAADYMLASPAKNIVALRYSQNAVEIEWHDGTRLLTSLGSYAWPDVVGQLLADTDYPSDDAHFISDEWRKDVLTLCELGEDELTLAADHATAGRGKSRTRLDVATPVPNEHDYSRWSIPFLEPVLRRATHIDFTRWPRPLTFRWQNVHGLVAARR